MGEPVEVMLLAGFDPAGEPQVRWMTDGSLYVVFGFMPPSWAEGAPGRFDDFDRQLAAAAGVQVEWEDREFFRVPRPAADTVERVGAFLGAYRR